MRVGKFIPAVAVLAATSALAADMLPLKNGIYVPTNVAYKGAPNADIVNYWGGDSGIGVAQAECTIKTLTKKIREAEDKLAELTERQERLRKKGQEAAGLADAAQRQQAL